MISPRIAVFLVALIGLHSVAVTEGAIPCYKGLGDDTSIVTCPGEGDFCVTQTDTQDQQLRRCNTEGEVFVDGCRVLPDDSTMKSVCHCATSGCNMVPSTTPADTITETTVTAATAKPSQSPSTTLSSRVKSDGKMLTAGSVVVGVVLVMLGVV